MGLPSNAFDAFAVIGFREDLTDVIYNISPTDTPFMQMIARTRADAVHHEWQIDSLKAAADNIVIEGIDAVLDAVEVTQRIGNYCQISDKTVTITGTLEAISKAGRKSELAYQLAKKSKELKRDVETRLTGNFIKHAGATDATGRQSGSLEAWIFSNDVFGGGAGASAASTAGNLDVSATRTDGDLRAITEALVKEAIQLAWTDGGDPTIAMCGPVNKQRISAFTGNSTRFDRGEDKRLVAAIDVYVSDFGVLRIVPNRFSRDRTVTIIDPSLWAMAYLRSFRQWPLSKTGDTEKRQLLVEYTLVSRNEEGNSGVFDLTT